MIDLYIRNKKIATFEENEITFSFENPAYSFDDLSLSRTSTFSLPIDENNQFFEMSSRPEYDGARKKIQAEMRYSGGYVIGYLYVIDYTNEEDGQIVYNCIFVYGELQVLKKINDAGSIGDYCKFDDTLQVESEKVQFGGQTNGEFLRSFSFVQYRNNIGLNTILQGYVNYSPIVKLRYLIDTAALELGVSVDYGDTRPDRFGLILPTNNSVPPITSVSFNGFPAISETFTGTGISGVFDIVNGKLRRRNESLGMFTITDDIHVINCLVDVKCTFPRQPGIVIIKANRNNVCKDDFLSFDNSWNSIDQGYGNSADITVEFSAGESFMIFSNSNWSNAIYGFDYNTVYTEVTYSFTIETSAPDSVTYASGDAGTYSLQENLPDVTLIDLLKTLAALTRRGLYYMESTLTFSFFDYSYNEDPVELQDALIRVTKVERYCCDYAQKNIIDCDSEDYVNEKSKFIISRSVRNDYLEEEKKIYTIPFSEGNEYRRDGLIMAAVDDWNVNDSGDGYENSAGNATIVMANANTVTPWCLHINTLNPLTHRVNDNLSRIMNIGTRITARVRIRLFDFLKINVTTNYKFEGQRYFVYSADWSNGEAEMILQKISYSV